MDSFTATAGRTTGVALSMAVPPLGVEESGRTERPYASSAWSIACSRALGFTEGLNGTFATVA